MHIAVLSDGITPFVTGGMQRHTFHLVRHLLLLGIDISLVHTIPYAVDLPSDDEVRSLFGTHPAKLEVIGIPFLKRSSLPGHYIRESYQYSVSIANRLLPTIHQFDFIYAKGFTAWNLLERKRRGVHLPAIGVKFHGYEMFQKANTLRTRMEQNMFRPAVMFNVRNANVVFSYGGEITRIIEQIGVDPAKITEITSGVDSKWIKERIMPTQGKRKFVFIGRSERRKGINELRQALDKLPSELYEMHWVGPIEPKYIATGEYAHGEIREASKIREILDSCDVLVAPSHAEGMPNVILEGMARGLAIIATPVGAVPVVVSELNGLLVTPGKIDQLAKAIEYMANLSAEELDQMKRQNLKDIQERFSWNAIALQTLDTIKRQSFTVR